MVDGIELAVGDEVLKVWELNCGCAGRGEEPSYPLDKVMDIGDVSKDVVGHHKVGRAVVLAIFVRHRCSEESDRSAPLSMASAATLAAGSTPKTRHPASTKFRNRWPSLLASSTTKLVGESESRLVASTA